MRRGRFSATAAGPFGRDRKPHPRPFRRALEILGVPAAEAVFVGDDPVWDVEGANRAGLRLFLLRGQRRKRASPRLIPAATLPEVLANIEQLNSTASTGPQPVLA